MTGWSVAPAMYWSRSRHAGVEQPVRVSRFPARANGSGASHDAVVILRSTAGLVASGTCRGG